MVGDSGGKAPQWGKGVIGAEKVAQVLRSMIPLFFGIGGKREPHVVNGQSGPIFRDWADKVLNTWTLDILDGRIQANQARRGPQRPPV